nr:hypothetical protein Iba_chr06bCG11040 [Ipomoea batatas]
MEGRKRGSIPLLVYRREATGSRGEKTSRCCSRHPSFAVEPPEAEEPNPCCCCHLYAVTEKGAPPKPPAAPHRPATTATHYALPRTKTRGGGTFPAGEIREDGDGFEEGDGDTGVHCCGRRRPSPSHATANIVAYYHLYELPTIADGREEERKYAAAGLPPRSHREQGREDVEMLLTPSELRR